MLSSLGQSRSPNSSITAPKDLVVESATHTTSSGSSITASKQDLEETWSVKRRNISNKRETTLEKRVRVVQNQLQQLLEIAQQSRTQPIFLEECLGEVQNQLYRLISQNTPLEQIPKLVRQLESQPISEVQLIAEVKGIYAGLVMIEGKCIQVDAKQAAIARETPLGQELYNELWQASMALHHKLLQEHHDFLIASQHPSATPAVRRLAIKYAMPARLWRHGIYSFLEVLRNQLPEARDHMLAFIYLAYSEINLLYETAPAFEETWIECLRELSRYRIAIEDDVTTEKFGLKFQDSEPAKVEKLLDQEVGFIEMSDGKEEVKVQGGTG